MFRLRDLRGGKRLLSSRIPPFLSLIQPTQQVSARQLFFYLPLSTEEALLGKKKVRKCHSERGRDTLIMSNDRLLRADKEMEGLCREAHPNFCLLLRLIICVASGTPGR